MVKIIKLNKDTTVDEIVKLENQLQITLPSDYRGFLLEYNGGIPDNLQFTAIKYGDSLLSELFGLGISGVNSLNYALTTFSNRIPSDFLSIGRDQLGNLILLGIKDKYIGKVYFWWHENESEGKKPWLKNVYKISDSFNKFLEDLKPETSNDELKGTLLDLFDSENYEKQLELINSGWDVNTKMEVVGGTAIERVAMKGNTDVLKALIAKGAKLDTALENTLLENNVEACHILLESGADPNLKTNDGKSTILLDAISRERINIVILLIDKGASVNVANKYFTALALAELKVQKGNKLMQEVVDLIKSKL